ncbi:TPA: zinc-binding dehydrogenase [Staphylococcus aureus]|nr:zinc-binding dehydrogenase [Staphylococcus aureus]HCQ3508394.1 zinc-binding dehydrogenase [Staphylococcus aureus]HCQ3511052.1 zinc-binding dehydrogenase [Staphylococcus aureus]HCQ3514163.1 zinc-binding dehydrogenase [Staphylococcus aureus]
MSYFTDFVRGFLDLGATVILPVVIFLLGLFFRQKIGAAFRSGLTIGVAFVGIFLVIDLLVKNLGPAAQAMVKNLGVSLNVIDVGWPATSSIAWASSVAAFIIPLGIIVNVVLLVTKVTKTMNVDIWNFWHYTFTAAMVEPSAVVAHGFYKSNIQPGMTVAVMGCGSIGLLAIQWARIFGAAHIIAIDIDAHKLDIATSLGAHQTINSKEENLEKFIENHYANQIDLAIESSGAKVTIGQILTLPKKGGEVVLLGIPYDDIEIDRVHFEKILRNELTVCGSWNCLSSNFPGKEWTATLHYMKTKDINVKPIISHFLPLEKGPETFDKLVNKKERFDKVMFTNY